MRVFYHAVVGLLIVSLAATTGCRKDQGGPPTSPKATPTTGDDDHDHGPGPHNGKIIEFGKWHGEFTNNPKTQEAIIYILGGDAKTPAPIPVEKLLLSVKAPQFQVELKADPQEGDPKGKCSRFVVKHENFGKEQVFEGTLSGEVNGKPYAGDFKTDPPKKE